ncbi:hypothetical protein RSOLAG1IB_12606 [Rhizoctonia solani AG-1 IB]|uniref:Uncharacterized protein n=1 Tax=Thanatephorus cucumeris (strain AG1-IB / isolate 7/3/14) TaxID=1108050 RepID=A0A0B7G381_THACB|nr:hypothetical protein RSOLAG1IB_12606 [Rhizoctonia solani AG-1 IB]
MPPRKRKAVSTPDPSCKQTRFKAAENASEPPRLSGPATTKRVRPRMRPVPAPSPSPPAIDIEDEDVVETGGSKQRHSVHWSPDIKRDSDMGVNEMIDDLLSSDPEPEVDELKSESSPEPESAPKKITLRLGSKRVNLSEKTTQVGNHLASDDGITVAYESADHLGFAIHKNGIKQRTVGIPIDINYDTLRLQVANEYQIAGAA